jgi:polysaccharide deacetylase family protein (PEP-CTERM system associated)
MHEGDAMINALTIDVEDYYQVSAFESTVRFEAWPSYESRVDRNVRRMLDILDEHSVRATFFVLGWEAEQRPHMIEEIAKRGHEIGSHGYRHRLIYSMSPQECRDDILKSKTELERIISAEVVGYRAASYSITARSLWCLDVLIELGFQYDSSIFPIHHDRYGIPSANRFIHRIERPGGSLVELPPATVRALGMNFPLAGGAYLRFLPAWLVAAGIRHLNTVEHQPAILYLHPWEIDPDQPRLAGSMASRIRHYTNLRKVEAVLHGLLERFTFGSVGQVLAQHSAVRT